MPEIVPRLGGRRKKPSRSSGEKVEREKEVGNKPIVFSLDRTQNRTSRANRRVLTGWRTEPLAKAVGLRKKKKLL
jgi:hypothetical protein